LTFTDGINVNVSAFWRLFYNDHIALISLDHMHQFGLPKPINLEELLQEKLSEKRLTKIEVDNNTGDLTLTLSDQYKLNIYTSSIGYESYSFSFNDKRYFGLGFGEIAIMNIQ